NNTIYDKVLHKFKKSLNYKMKPRIFIKRKTFSENSRNYNKQMSLSFKQFIKVRLPKYMLFMKKSLSKHNYEKNNFLIKSYFINKYKNKFVCICPAFFVNIDKY